MRNLEIKRGQVRQATNGKLYGVCSKCGSLVRVDKPVFGGLHLCEPNK